MHDLPPPTFFSDGSLEAHLKDTLTASNGPGTRWLHKCVPVPGSSPYISHVRILQGNGDIIYQDLNAANSVIKVWLKDTAGNAGDLTISGDPSGFQIDSDEKLNGGGVGTGIKGRKKYTHPGKGGRPFRISRITVDKTVGAVSHFEVNAPPPTDYEEEYRIMIWHEDHHQTTVPGSPGP
jgi:hypothetical protein